MIHVIVRHLNNYGTVCFKRFYRYNDIYYSDEYVPYECFYIVDIYVCVLLMLIVYRLYQKE